MQQKHFDVVVLGGGSAGIAAAIATARNGASTALVEAGPMLGGELLTGMTIDGALNGRGERVVGGVIDLLLEGCRALGGFVAPLCDWRLIHYIAYDPEIMKIAIAQAVFGSGTTVYLHSFAEEAVREGDRITGLVIRNKAGRTLLTADLFIDASGDADLCAMAGLDLLSVEKGSHPQPVSMMFRMAGVDTPALLDFVASHPENVAVGESDAIRGGRTDAEIVAEMKKQGQPCVFFKSDGPLLGDAIRDGRMFPTALIMIQPTSEARREVCINATRVSLGDPLATAGLSAAMGELVGQVTQCAAFLSGSVPGFAGATLSGLAPRVGIRETRRIIGDEMLDGAAVLAARKREDGVAKGSHHVDIHQSGTGQVRIPVANGGSYDIPLGALIPKGIANVAAAGRCLSATREAQGSARVMGGCMAMGQAVGTLAALARREANSREMRSVPVARLREVLRSQGAVLDGVA